MKTKHNKMGKLESLEENTIQECVDCTIIKRCFPASTTCFPLMKQMNGSEERHLKWRGGFEKFVSGTRTELSLDEEEQKSKRAPF